MGFSSKNAGMGCHFFLHGIFPTQASNPRLLHCRRILYCWATRETLVNALSTAIGAQAPRTCALQQQKPPQWEACAPQQRVAPAPCNRRKPMLSNKDPAQPKINLKKKSLLHLMRRRDCFMVKKMNCGARLTGSKFNLHPSPGIKSRTNLLDFSVLQFPLL